MNHLDLQNRTPRRPRKRCRWIRQREADPHRLAHLLERDG